MDFATKSHIAYGNRTWKNHFFSQLRMPPQALLVPAKPKMHGNKLMAESHEHFNWELWQFRFALVSNAFHIFGRCPGVLYGRTTSRSASRLRRILRSCIRCPTIWLGTWCRNKKASSAFDVGAVNRIIGRVIALQITYTPIASGLPL